MNLIYIKNVMLITVDPTNRIIHDGFIAIQDNKIHSLGKMSDLQADSGATIIDGHNRMAILPGLIDAHSHSSLLKGYTENRQLIEWLGEYQREHQVLNEDDAFAAALVSYSEALLGGTTLVVDMYRFPLDCARAAGNLGIRVDLVPYAADAPGKDFFETLATTENLISQLKRSPQDRVTPWIGLEHLFYCSREMCREARDLADREDVRIHTHTSEQKEEVEAVVAQFGARPVEVLLEYGVLKPKKTTLAHCVWLSEKEIEILSKNQIGIIHCPTSNAKLACGIADITHYQKKGISVALGSDGSISNNSLSMFECMKMGSLFQKLQHLNAGVMNAHDTLRMATAGAAELLGYGDQLGSLEVGKRADFIALDLWQPHLLPLERTDDHDPLIWNIIYSARASDVLHVWIDGEQVVENKQLKRMKLEEIMAIASSQTRSLLNRRNRTSAVPMIKD